MKQADSLNRQDPGALKQATDGDEMCHTTISSGPLRNLGFLRHTGTHPTAISGTTKTTPRARHYRRRLVNQRNYTGLRSGRMRSGTHTCSLVVKNEGGRRLIPLTVRCRKAAWVRFANRYIKADAPAWTILGVAALARPTLLAEIKAVAVTRAK